MKLKMIINRAARKAQRFGRLDEYFFSLGIQAFSMDEFVEYLNNNGLEKDKVVVKTNSGYQDCRDDDYKPQGMVFLVIDAELMTKIAVLGFLPESSSV
jgi:hypothetical protein